MAILFGGLSVAALITIFDGDDDTDAPDGSTDEDAVNDGVAIEGSGGTVEIVDEEIIVRGDDTQEWRSWAEPTDEIWSRWSASAFTYKNYDGPGGYIRYDDDDRYVFVSYDDGDSFDSLPGLLQVQGTSDADTISLFGIDIDLRSSGGGGYIDTSNLSSGWVYGTDGDTILGSDVLDNQVSYNGENYDYVGTATDETVGLGGDGSGTVFAGEGNDTIIGYGRGDQEYQEYFGESGDNVIFTSGSGSASGGDGNDYVSGTGYAFQLPKDLIREGSGRSAHAMLDGGAGDDTVHFDHGDTVTGGDGADAFKGFLRSNNQTAAIVADFDPAEDSLNIWIGEELTGGVANDVTLTEENGNTSIMIAGTKAAVVEGQTGLTVGYYDLEEREDSGHLPSDAIIIDADGNQIERASVDIVICTYENAYRYPWT